MSASYRNALVAIVGVGLLCSSLIVVVDWLRNLSVANNPARIFARYRHELGEYVEKVAAGKFKEKDGQFPIPAFLIDHGARYVEKEGDCVVITFSFLPTDEVPELWYCPKGFLKLPEGLGERRSKTVFKLVELAPQWAECRWNQ